MRRDREAERARWAKSSVEVNGVMQSIEFRRPFILSVQQWPDAPGVLYYSIGFFTYLAASRSGELPQ